LTTQLPQTAASRHFLRSNAQTRHLQKCGQKKVNTTLALADWRARAIFGLAKTEARLKGLAAIQYDIRLFY
jgi:hypothetical protein